MRLKVCVNDLREIYKLQYRNRVSPHAAKIITPTVSTVLKLQYRNRVSPHAALKYLPCEDRDAVASIPQ